MIRLRLIVRVFLRIVSLRSISRSSGRCLFRRLIRLFHLGQFVLGLKVFILVIFKTGAHNFVKRCLINFLLTLSLTMSMLKFDIGVVKLISVIGWFTLSDFFLMLWAVLQCIVQRCCVSDVGRIVFVLVSDVCCLINCPRIHHTMSSILCHLLVILDRLMTRSGSDLVLVTSHIE